MGPTGIATLGAVALAVSGMAHPPVPTRPADHPGHTARPAANRCGPITLTASQGVQPAPVCLRRGATLHITTEPSPHQPWSLPLSSDTSVLRCAAHRLPGGAAAATCTARRLGTATITTCTSAFAGDPHGPPQYLWQVQVTVVDRSMDK
jgi:hypothetical protein